MRKVTLIAAVLTCGALALGAPSAYARGGGGGGGGHGGGGHGGGHGGHSGGHHGGHHGGHFGGHHGGSWAHHHGYRGGYGGYGYGGYGGYGYGNYFSWYPWYGNYGYPGYGYGYGSGYGNYGNYYYPNYYWNQQNYLTCPNGQCPAGAQTGAVPGTPDGLPPNQLPQMSTVSQEQLPAAKKPAPIGPDQLRIRNPRDSRGDLTYVLNGMPYKIEPGQAQILDAKQKWVIAFNRGPGMGSATYTLSSGMTYAFSVTAQGWELLSHP